MYISSKKVARHHIIGDPLNKLQDKSIILENQILNILTQKAWRANVNSQTWHKLTVSWYKIHPARISIEIKSVQ